MCLHLIQMPVPAQAQSDGYEDVSADSLAAEHIAALAAEGVFDDTGCAVGSFCPNDPLPRWMMAVWLVRVIDGEDPLGGDSRFADLGDEWGNGPWWEGHVERLAELQVTLGCTQDPQPRFCPDDFVTRDQMAAFLVRAFGLQAAAEAGFGDVAAGSTFHADINALANSHITIGCNSAPLLYCPHRQVTRAHMAVFLGRAVDFQAGRPTVALESSASRFANGGFDVTITFSVSVTGFSVSSIQVVNGEVASLTGSGVRYTATIDPAAQGAVLVRVKPGGVDDVGRQNAISLPLVRTITSDPARSRPGTDTWNRDTVTKYASSEFDRTEPEWGFTGDVTECTAGATSREFRNSVIQRVNWYRRMAGLDDVAEKPEYSAGAQQTALMMLAADDLSHHPGDDWPCHSDTGAEYASGNLGLGTAGVSGIDGYMRDSGAHNLQVGHRLWVLYPQTRQMGTGNVLIPDSRYHGGYRFANSLWPKDDLIWGDRPMVREERGFVSWPPSGYVPPEAVWGRWSFSLSGADMSDAAVAMADDSGSVQTDVIYRSDAPEKHYRYAPERTVVWAVGGDTDSLPMPTPVGGDHCYTVTVSGVKIAGVAQAPYEYPVCVLG